MKPASPIQSPVLLKTILDICFYILLFSFIGSILITVWQAWTEEPFLNFKIQEHEVTELTLQVWVLIICQLFLAGIFIYVINLFRKLVRSFFKKMLFTKYQVSSLNLIGQLIILTSIGEVIVGFFANLILEEEARIEIEVDSSFGSFWFTLGIGMFFILLSKAFENARILKEENDLTV